VKIGMSDLINPKTDLPFNQERILEALRVWMTAPDVLEAMISSGMASKDQLRVVIGRAVATQAKEKYAFSPAETAVIALRFLRSRIVRLQIAKVVAKKEGIPKKEAMKGLWDLKEWLQEHYQVTDEGSVHENADVRE
jgi:hypothetical protein